MKYLLIICGAFIISACSSNPYDWTDEETKAYSETCLESFGIDKENFKDEMKTLQNYCDCIAKQVKREYKYEDAVNVDYAEIQDILQDCTLNP